MSNSNVIMDHVFLHIISFSSYTMAKPATDFFFGGGNKWRARLYLGGKLTVFIHCMEALAHATDYQDIIQSGNPRNNF